MSASVGESGSCDAALPAASVTSKPAKTVFMATLLNHLGAIRLAHGLPGAFARALGVDLGAADPTTEDDLAGFGAHGAPLQRRLWRCATPLGLGAGSGRVAL